MRKFYFLLIALSFAFVSNAQLTGTKTIPGDYATISAAVTALNTSGVGTGGVTFNVAAGYTETLTGKIVLTATGTAANPIVFQKSGTGANPVLTSYVGTVATPAVTADGFFVLVGSDYVSIDGIDLLESSANTTATTVMEFGYALFKASATDGAQNNNIKNCTITLSRVQSAGWTTTGYNGSIGIVMLNTTNTAVTALTVTAATGSNSNNKFYTNLIQNAYVGMAFVGYVDATSPYSNADTGNDIGGAIAATGNTILNFAGGTVTSAGLYFSSQNALNCRFNTVNNNNGSGANHTTTLRGVYWTGSLVSSSGTVSDNTVTLTSSATTSQLGGIEYAASSNSSQTVNISNNIVTTSYPTATSGNSYSIYTNGGAPGTLNLNSNTISLSTAGTSGSNYEIYNSCSVVTALNINSNAFVASASATTTSLVLRHIYCSGGAATCTTTISSNQFNSVTYTGTTWSGAWAGVYQSGAPLNEVISNNNFNNLTVPTTAAAYLIYNSYTAPANGSKTVQNNSVVTGFTRATITSSNIYGYYDYGSSPGTVTHTISGNNFSNITSCAATSGACYFYGIYSADNTSAPYPTCNVYNNTISNNTHNGTGYFYPIYLSGLGGTSGTPILVYGNTVSSNTSNSTSTSQTGILISSTSTYVNTYDNVIQNNTFSGAAAQFVGIYCGGTTALNKFYNNTITNNTGTGTAAIVGIMLTGGIQVDCYQNKINNLTSLGSAWGIYISGGTLVNVYDHKLIGANDYSIKNISSSGAAVGVEGIRVAGGTTVNLYKNNITGLSNSSSSTTATFSMVNGLSLTAGTTISAYNNTIGNLTAPAVSYPHAITGILVSSTTTSAVNKVYNNTVYLNASSTGANFGVTGVYHATSATATTGALDLINNVIINNSTASGTGIVTALRRNAASVLSNFATTSNKNLYNSASGTILYDGTTSFGFSAYKNAVTPRDADAYVENPSFVSTTGSDATYLHINTVNPTQIESGGSPISGITTDIDGDTRNVTTPDLGADEFSGVIAPPMVYASSTATQLTPSACVGTNDIQVLKMEVTTTGIASPLTLTSLSINGAGTSNLADISSYRIYYTGTNSTFSTSNPIIAATAGLTASDVVVTPSSAITLATGTNYFWLVYNISATATGQYVDGQFTSISLSTGGGTPTVTDPAGALAITAKPSAAASSSSPVCTGTTLNLTGTSDLGTTFSWTGPGGYSSISQSPSISNVVLSAAGTYTFTATASGCTSDPSTTTVIVNQSPTAITISPVGPICTSATPQLLTATGGLESNLTILSENFNGTAAGWTMTNNSTGGTPANSAWTLRADGYVYTNTFHSNDNSQFIMTNSDAAGSGSTAATILKSPAFSTANYTAANLSFYHYYYEPTSGSSTGLVQASTDNTNWTTLQTYNSTTGGYAAFANATIALPSAFLNQATVYIRFKYDGVWRYYWSIDNVSITGSRQATFLWTPNGAGNGLYTDAAGTTIYSGTSVTSLYAKPTISTTYTAKSTAANGCYSSATVQINVAPAPVISGSATVCASATGVTYSVTNNSGSTYAWTVTGGTIASGSNTNSINVNWGVAGTGTVSVTETITATSCSTIASPISVTINPIPTAFNVTGTGSYCSGGTGLTVGLDGSETGISYQLYLGGNLTGSPVAGTGSAISFGAQTAGGTYTVVASNTTTSCTENMTGSAVITVNPVPVISTTLFQPTTCASTDGEIVVTMSGAAGPYTFSWSTTGGNGLVTGAQTQTTLSVGSYTLVAQAANGCSASSTVSLAGPGGCSVCPSVPSVSANMYPVCAGNNFTLSAAGLADMGISYGVKFLYSATALVNPYSGGTAISTVPNSSLFANGTIAVTTTSISTPGTYYMYAILSPAPVDPNCRPYAVTQLTIADIPTLSLGANPSVCYSTSASAGTISYTSSVAVSTYNVVWNAAALAAGFTNVTNGTVSGSTLSLPVPAGAAAATYSGTITVSSGSGCASSAVAFSITVNPTPTVDAVSNQTVCNDAATTAITFAGAVTGTTYSWTNSNPAIGLASSGTGNIASFTAVNTGTTPVTSTVTVTPSAFGPVVTPVASPVTINYADRYITYTGVSINGGSNSAIVAAGSSVSLSYNYSVAFDYGTGYCPGCVVQFYVGLGGSNQTLTCVNPIGGGSSGTQSSTFTAPSTPGVYYLTQSGTLDYVCQPQAFNNLPSNAIGYIQVGATGCVGAPRTFTITVNPTPTVAAVSNQALCNGLTTTAVAFTGTVTGTTYSWTNSAPSIGLAASGTGNIPAFTAVNTGGTAVTATITVTPSANGCAGTPITYTYTVNPTSTVNAVSNQTVCNGAATSAVTFSGAVAGEVFSWTNNTTSIGLAAAGTGNIPSFTAVNTGTTPVTATVSVTANVPGRLNYTMYSTHGGNGNTSQYASFPNTAAEFDNLLNTANSNTVVSSTGTADPASVIYWNGAGSLTAAGISVPNGGDYFAIKATGTFVAAETGTYTFAVDGDDAVDVAINGTVVCSYYGGHGFGGWHTGTIDLVAGTSYTFTARFQEFGGGEGINVAWMRPSQSAFALQADEFVGGCASAVRTFTITVNPTPTVAAVSNQTVCNGANTTAVTFAGAVTGTTYAWTNSNTAIGLAASGTGNIASFAGTNTTAAPITATITATPSANGCTGSPTSFTITVNPTATVNAIANQVLCKGSNTTAVTFAGPVAGTTYAWTNSNTAIGLAASGTGTGIASFATTNTTTAPLVATITVTPTANGCVGTPLTFTITVNPTPTVAAVSNQVLCHGSSTAAVTFAGTVTGTVYNWTNTNTSIGLAASGSGNIASFVATNTGSAQQVATITVTPSYTNGGVTCLGTPITFTITVNPLPVVSAGTLPSRICISDSLVALNGTPVGGYWTGIGTSGFNFVPNAAALGSYTLRYTFTDANNCTNSATIVATVNECIDRNKTLAAGAVTLFPNPNDGNFYLKVNSHLFNNLSMRVYNAAGQLVSTKQWSGVVYGRTMAVNLTNLPAGIYVVQLYYGDGQEAGAKVSYRIILGH